MDGIGEEIVVGAIVLRVVSALRIARLYEAVGVCVLGIAALIVEIFLAKNRFEALRSRPGASAGIFLASVTWPLVLASRSHISEGNGSVLFWTATLCSFRLLILICYISKKNSKLATLEESLFTVNTAGALFSLFVLNAFTNGFRSLFIIGVIFIQVFGSGVIFQQIFRKFPGSATPGEASLVASGLSLYAGNTLLQALQFDYSVKSTNGVASMLQVAVLGLSLMPLVYKFMLRLTRNRKTASFSGAVIFVVAIVAPAWWNYVVRIQRHPVLWLVDFLLEEPVWRFGLCIYWLVVLSVLPYLYNVAKAGLIPQILIRKSYHVVAVVMFVPALMFQREFLHLALTVAFVAFSLVEMLRIWQIPRLGPKITEFMTAFADHRDTNNLIVSHFSLLLGCALPVWLHGNNELRPVAPFAGVLSIGIGDTMASYAGYNYGSWRLSRKTKKTVEGTTAGIVSLVFSCSLIQKLLPTTQCSLTAEVTTAAVFAGLVEAYTSQLDNIFVPLIFYGLLCL